jgi:histidinol-phosphatase (PHP family)
MLPEPWRVSLHGGHSGEFCEHATGRLREVLEAAAAAGYQTFGVTEHAPRSEFRFVYDSEKDKGFTVERLQRDFEAYAEAVRELSEQFAGRLVVLRGFEAEVVPAQGYREEMRGHHQRFGFDYMVGSVHYVDEISIDSEKAEFERATEACGGLEALAVRYYETVAAMVAALRPDVVGHLDLLRKNAGPDSSLDTPKIRRAADVALAAVRERACILDLNTGGYRKGLGTPYPAPWLVKRASEMGIPFCFGDDSHGPAQVGAGIDKARQYLLENGVGAVTVLTRDEGEIVRRVVSL